MDKDMNGLAGMIRETIILHALLSGGERVLTGLSGGPDSVCLLHVLHELRSAFSLSLHAVYVNHNLRPEETEAETRFCETLCRDLDIPFVTKSVEVRSFARDRRMNLQEAAREIRYAAFDEAAAETGAHCIALAHNADDQAETFLMRMLRGAGPAGLAGMPFKRGRIIRPLLSTERGEIEAYLAERGIPSVLDSSNLKTRYLRNWMRMSLMPELKRINPSLIRVMTRTMEILQEEERYLGIIVTKALMKMISRKTASRIELFLAPLETLDVVILRRVLRRAIDETEGIRGVGFVHLEDIIRLVKAGKAGDRISLPRGIRVIRDYALLVITADMPARIAECGLPVPGEAVLRGAGLVVKAGFDDGAGDVDGRSAVLLDAGKLRFPLTVRARRPGDFFYPMGFGRRKKIQDYFVDEKVPRDERDSVPLVLSGDQIVWVAGFRGDERFRVTEETKKVVRLGIVKGKF